MASLIYNVLILVIQTTSAGQGPPPPSQNRGPGLPIDDNLWILFVGGILLGAYILYKRRSRFINKAS